MKVRRSGLVAVFLVAGLTACDHDSPFASEDLVAAAPSLSQSALIEDLDLTPGQEAEVEQKVGELHEAMMSVVDVHERMNTGLSEDDRNALFEEAHGIMGDLHQAHDDLMGSLTEDQQKRFVEHVHERLEQHHDEMRHDEMSQKAHLDSEASDAMRRHHEEMLRSRENGDSR